MAWYKQNTKKKSKTRVSSKLAKKQAKVAASRGKTTRVTAKSSSTRGGVRAKINKAKSSSTRGGVRAKINKIKSSTTRGGARKRRSLWSVVKGRARTARSVIGNKKLTAKQKAARIKNLVLARRKRKR